RGAAQEGQLAPRRAVEAPERPLAADLQPALSACLAGRLGVERGERRAVLHADAVERRAGQRLVARQLRVVDGARGARAAGIVVRERLVVLREVLARALL